MVKRGARLRPQASEGEAQHGPFCWTRRIALSDDYFVEKRLCPNLDFYSAITLRALGFPTEMFTVLYAIARTAGWIAHWKEMIDDPSQRIGRPRQLYTGATERTYVPMEVRS